MANGHARFSPSGSSAWMVCAGWKGGVGSEYADEGTAAHELASWCLNQNLRAEAFEGRVIEVNTRSFTVDAEMIEAVNTYLDLVDEKMAMLKLLGAVSVELHVEVQIPIDHLTGEDGATGTSDCIIIGHFADAPSMLICGDYKHGQGVRVLAPHNPQAQMYALGAIEKFSLSHEFDKVLIFISQPRISKAASEWETNLAELNVFAEEVRCAANRAALPETDEFWTRHPYRVPGEKQCKFCAHKADCVELRGFVSQEAFGDFHAIHLDVEPPPVMPTDTTWLARVFGNLDLIEDWCKAIRAKVAAELFSGHAVPGYKLVKGKRGNRKWADDAEVEKTLKSMRLKQEEMYSFTLISPTVAEKLLKPTPKRWARLQNLITQAEGGAHVAHISDDRPAFVPPDAANDFQPLDAECDLA